MTRALARIAIAAAFLLGIAGTASANLIVNGDFEAGNAGFSSDYVYCNTQGCLLAGIPVTNDSGNGMYAVGPDSSFFHPNFTYAGDHTPGPGGNMMIVNGSLIPEVKVWSGTFIAPHMQAGTAYSLSLWAMNVVDRNQPANLKISFGGNTFSNFQLPDDEGVWHQFSTNFVANNSNSSVIDVNIEFSGNDFALDDIELELAPAAVPDGGLTLALLGLGLTALGLMRRTLG
jgi:hypothetical protein